MQFLVVAGIELYPDGQQMARTKPPRGSCSLARWSAMKISPETGLVASLTGLKQMTVAVGPWQWQWLRPVKMDMGLELSVRIQKPCPIPNAVPLNRR
jgi:hypothetical protein